MPEETLTPKQLYEARKAERQRENDQQPYSGMDDKMGREALDMFDRFATSLERIAEAMEKSQ